MQYKPLYSAESLIYGKLSHIAVVTGWTPLEQVLTETSLEFAVAGNLYSANIGIDYLIRNLLANPQITHIVGLSATPQDISSETSAMTALKDFFDRGVTPSIKSGKPIWQIVTPIKFAYLRGDLAIADLDKLRESVSFTPCGHSSELRGAIAKLMGEQITSVREAKIYIVREETNTAKYGQEYVGAKIEGETVAEVWVKVLQRIVTTGKEYPTRFGSTMHEVENILTVVTNDDESFPSFLPTDKEAIATYIKSILTPTLPTPFKKPHYTYGDRIRSYFGFDQLETVIALLKNKPDARNAVIDLWDVHHDPISSEPPCLNHLWFRLRDKRLDLTAVFRSNDMFNAWVTNVYGLFGLIDYIAPQLDCGRGSLSVLSQSAHIYNNCLESAQDIINTEYRKYALRALKRYDDPIGNFVIKVSNSNEIYVTHISPDGLHINTYKGKNPEQLGRDIIFNVPSIRPDHALYLGEELQKAAHRLSLYQQDSKK